MSPAEAESDRFGERLARELGLDPSAVRHVRSAHRPRTRLHRYEVDGPGSPEPVLVKVHVPGPEMRTGARAELLPPPSAGAPGPAAGEAEALRAVEARLGQRGDPALRAAPILAAWPDDEALALGFVPGTSLDRLTVRAALPGPDRAVQRIERAYELAGRWLREFHAIDLERPVRLADASAVVHAGSVLARELEPAVGRRRSSALAEALARALLPGPLPLGFAHGDLALRNVIVGDGPSVAIIDTRGRWRAPVFEDLAYLVLSLRAGRLAIGSAGLLPRPTLVGRLESAFLAGYGITSEQRTQVRAFGVLVLLDRWVALRERRRGGLRRAADALVERAFSAEAGRLLAALPPPAAG